VNGPFPAANPSSATRLSMPTFNGSRPHLSLDRNSPTPRDVEPPWQGEVVSTHQVGGLHHRYTRAA
jgi:hypothetical protein